MAIFFNNDEKRVVLPNWRSFSKTAQLGELSNISKEIQPKDNLELLINDWHEQKSIGVAADLVSAATINLLSDLPDVKDAAKFIIKNYDKASEPLLSVAKKINGEQINFNEQVSIAISESIEANSLTMFNGPDFQKRLHQQINRLKVKAINNPRNAINWIELSRLYSIVSENDKAFRAIKNAVFLNNTNRFILRSMTRFCIRHNEIEYAHDILRKSDAVKHDPWLLATEISLASFRNRFSKFISNGKSIANDANLNPFHISELSSALGTLELENGNAKNGKLLFSKSLVKPNDNALAQAEWVSENIMTLDNFDIKRFAKTPSFEALAKDFFTQKKYTDALQSGINWFLDIPFSKKPILFSTHIATVFLNDQNKAIEIGKAGLISHPKDATILNNLAYSYCLQNEVDEATDMLDHAHNADVSDIEKVCLTATNGLLFFRKKQPEIGRNFYLKSIELAHNIGDRKLGAVALGNLIREEYLSGNKEYGDKLFETFDQAIKSSNDPHLNKLKEDILKLNKIAFYPL